MKPVFDYNTYKYALKSVFYYYIKFRYFKLCIIPIFH